MPYPRFIFTVEQEKPPTAGPDQFPTESPICHRLIIPLVDLRIRHIDGPFLFTLPMNIHQASKLLEVAILQSSLAFPTKVFNKMQVFDHGFVSSKRLGFLFV